MSNPESPGKNLSPNLRQGNGSDCILKQSGFREGMGGGQLWRVNSKCSSPERNSSRLEPAKVDGGGQRTHRDFERSLVGPSCRLLPLVGRALLPCSEMGDEKWGVCQLCTSELSGRNPSIHWTLVSRKTVLQR